MSCPHPSRPPPAGGRGTGEGENLPPLREERQRRACSRLVERLPDASGSAQRSWG